VKLLFLFLKLSQTFLHTFSFGLNLIKVLLQFGDNLFLTYEAPLHGLTMSMMPPASAMTAATTTATATVTSAWVAVMSPLLSMAVTHPRLFSVTMFPTTAMSPVIHFVPSFVFLKLKSSHPAECLSSGWPF